MLKIIDKIISLKPNFPIMYHEKASILQDLGKFDEVINTIETVFKYEEDSIENYFRLYDVYEEKKNPNKCKEISNKLINILEEKIITLKTKISQKEIAATEQSTDISLVNKIADLYFSLGKIYKKIKKLELAKINFNLAISFNTSEIFYYIHLTKTYELMKKFTDARKIYEKAIKIEPLNIVLNISYAVLILEEFGEIEKAKWVEFGSSADRPKDKDEVIDPEFTQFPFAPKQKAPPG